MVVARSIGSDTILNCYIVSNSSLQTGLSATQFTSKLIVQISNSAKKRRSKYSKHMYNPATLLMKLSHRSKFKREIISELQKHFFCFPLDFCFKKKISKKQEKLLKLLYQRWRRSTRPAKNPNPLNPMKFSIDSRPISYSLFYKIPASGN